MTSPREGLRRSSGMGGLVYASPPSRSLFSAGINVWLLPRRPPHDDLSASTRVDELGPVRASSTATAEVLYKLLCWVRARLGTQAISFSSRPRGGEEGRAPIGARLARDEDGDGRWRGPYGDGWAAGRRRVTDTCRYHHDGAM